MPPCVTASHAKDPGFNSCRPHNHQDWWFSPSYHPATRVIGYWDRAGNPGPYNLVDIDMASRCIGPLKQNGIGSV